MKFVATSLFIFSLNISFAQQVKLSQTNWQQHLEYVINVSLDDDQHILRGNETVLYKNNSPDTLYEMYIHLWPNAYRNNETAFAKQQLENGQTQFYYLPEDDRGYIDSLNFLVDWVSVKWELTSNIDIAKLTLKKPIPPGEMARLATTFKVKLPKVVSRMGHEDQLYCVTQWYPKPAVYDVNGWNPMPYLDQGEFYSEFAKFVVNISVPKNYVVAASGRLQNADERNWLWEKSKYRFNDAVKYDKTFPPSDNQTKTLTFIQDSIHDFAWFADKRFAVERSEVTLPSGKKVTTWMYEVSPKESSIHLVDTSILFYSKMLGEYPYTDVSVCVTPLVSGAGMEYPMITNITEADRQVIVHEVGHNWLYGILATNEREYPWMDESINNYYETRSSVKKEPMLNNGSKLEKNKNQFSFSREGFDALFSRYAKTAFQNADQPCLLPSVAYTDENYGNIIYGKASLAFYYLQKYLDDSLFDSMMQSFYEKWKFKHPLPDDLNNHIKQYTGKELAWFFDDLLNTTNKQDVKIKKVKKLQNSYVIYLQNKGNVKAPVSVTGIINDSAVYTKWFEPTEFKTCTIPKLTFDAIRVDAFNYTLDLNKGNNTYYTQKVFKKIDPIEWKLIGGTNADYTKPIYYMPIAGWNLYNKGMLGLALYNSVLTKRNTHYVIAPMYSFGTTDLVGAANIQHYLLTYGNVKRVIFDAGVSQFASQYFLPTTYTKLYGKTVFELKPLVARTSPQQFVTLQGIHINERARDNTYLSSGVNTFYIDLSYSVNQNRVFNSYSYKFTYQLGNASTLFHKLWAEATTFIPYSKPKKGFSVRGYGASFLNSFPNNTADGRVVLRAGGNTGLYDYTFEQSQFGRGENPINSNSLFAQQLMFGGLEFKELYPLVTTDKWAVGTNLETTIPGVIPVVLYADIAFINANEGYFDGNAGVFVSSYSPKLLYTSGISLKLFKDVFRINLPFFASKEIRDYFNGTSAGNLTGPQRYTERITFSFNLNKLNPLKLARNISF